MFSDDDADAYFREAVVMKHLRLLFIMHSSLTVRLGFENKHMDIMKYPGEFYTCFIVYNFSFVLIKWKVRIFEVKRTVDLSYWVIWSYDAIFNHC